MLYRYNSEICSPPYHDSWMHSATFLDPSKDINDDYASDLHSSALLPRAKVATVKHHQTSTVFYSPNQPSEYPTQSQTQPINKYHSDFRYNIPLQELFHQKEINSSQQF